MAKSLSFNVNDLEFVRQTLLLQVTVLLVAIKYKISGAENYIMANVRGNR